MRSFTIPVVCLVLLVGGVRLHALDVPSSRIGDLRAAKEQLWGRAIQTKGLRRALLLMERQRLSAMIHRLERGEAVDPGEIDRLLAEAHRANF